MNLSRIRRLLHLISLLQGGREHNIDDMAQACRVSRRTVFRDLEVIREAGLPLFFDADQHRYRLSETCYLPPTNFSPDEALALIVLCHEMGADDRLPFFAAARQAAVKLEGVLPARLREHLRRMTHAVRIEPQPINRLDGQDAVYQRLLEAIAQERCVRIGYAGASDPAEISTRLSPYQLWFSRRSWYVVGRSSLHRGLRTFNLGRITRLEMCDESYRVPPGFSLDRYLRNAWHLIPEPGPDWEVLIRFRPMVARNVAEVCWHKTQQVAFLDDGSCDFRVTVSGLNEISWWILGYGDQAEVLQPQELRDLLAQRVARLAACYQVGPTPGDKL